MNAVLCLLFGVFAVILAVVLLFAAKRKLLDPPWILVGLVWLSFTVAFAWFAYGLFSPFEQRIEVSMATLKWMSGRCPVVEGEIEFNSVKSMIIQTDSDGLPVKIRIILKSGEQVGIPFAHVLGREAKSFVDILKPSWPNMEISIS